MDAIPHLAEKPGSEVGAMSQITPRPTGLSAPRTILDPNSAGEIKGYGAPWVCAAHGDEGHDYLSCASCRANFDRRFTKGVV